MLPGSVLQLSEAVLAWNADGSTSATTTDGESWIEHAEIQTGRQRGRCSYSGCNEMASVGGHVFLARRGVWIAPICRACNHPSNRTRWQGMGSTLRVGITVTKAERTEDMNNAARRTLKRCRACSEDMSRAPDHHEVCLRCYRRGHGGVESRRHCISDRSEQHEESSEEEEECLPCYRGGHGGAQLRRQCTECRAGISDRPEHHEVCLQCYRRGHGGAQLRRQCTECTADISDRPKHHEVCLRCYRRGHR